MQLLAGDEGFEPPNDRTKTCCLTTWPIPIVNCSAQDPTDKPGSVLRRLAAFEAAAIYLRGGLLRPPPAELRPSVQPVLQAGKVCLGHSRLWSACALTARFQPCPHALRHRWRFDFCCDCLGARARSGFPTTVAVACPDFPLQAFAQAAALPGLEQD